MGKNVQYAAFLLFVGAALAVLLGRECSRSSTASVIPSLSDRPAETGRWATVTNIRPPHTFGALRPAPGQDPLVAQLAPGTTVELLDHGESARSWCKVRSGNLTGYMHHDILEPKCE
jgi:hypothetical protein